MELPGLRRLEEAATLVASQMRPTPEICWAALSARCACEVWVKHENHTPTGCFKMRNALVYVDDLLQQDSAPSGIIAATRGNHGQSITLAARRRGLRATIVVPHGNSIEKNAAMRALGAELIEHGRDFQDALEHASRLAEERELTMVPSFDEPLVRGSATYGLEFLQAVNGMEVVYVPVGLGTGICGTIAAREALGLTTQIVGVVSEAAPTYALSFSARKPISTESANTIADGIAVRVPAAEAVRIINRYAERIVTVSDEEIAEAMRNYFTDTHNAAEGAGAAPLAALLKEREQMRGRKVGLVLSGGNVDRATYARILANV